MTNKPVAVNRQASFRYHIFDKMEAGIVLKGPEVKSIREGNLSLRDSFIRCDSGEAFIFNMYVKPYAYSRVVLEPTRERKLLLNNREIDRIIRQVKKSGFTCIPLRLYFNKRGKAKVEIALCQGKQLYDKRQDIKERDQRKEMDRAKKRYNK